MGNILFEGAKFEETVLTISKNGALDIKYDWVKDRWIKREDFKMENKEHVNFKVCKVCSTPLKLGKFAYDQEMCWDCFKKKVIGIAWKLETREDKEIVIHLLNCLAESQGIKREEWLMDIPQELVDVIDEEFEFRLKGELSGQYARGTIIRKRRDGLCLVELLCNGKQYYVQESTLRYVEEIDLNNKPISYDEDIARVRSLGSTVDPKFY